MKKLDSARKSYEAKKHLDQLVQEFNTKVNQLCKPHEIWYNIDKPELKIDKVLAPDVKIEPVSVEGEDEMLQIPLEID